VVGRTGSAVAARVPPSVRTALLSLTGRPNRRYHRPVRFPRVPPGWQVSPPDFVGVGAQKAGTSWWHSLLSQHPMVVTPTSADPQIPKELHYFDRFWDAEVPRDDIDSYQRYFPRPEGFLSGEWTPRYMSDPWTIPLLAHAAPQTRVLVLLRDPVDRYVSGFTHSLIHGLPRNARTAAEAFQRGLYAAQLKVILDHFDRSQVLVQQYESCRRDPSGELARTLAFLGLSPSAVAPSFAEVVNGTTRPKEPISPEVRQSLGMAYRRDSAELAEMFPDIDLSLWRSFRDQDQLPVMTAGR
jgi:hypothetical protein